MHSKTPLLIAVCKLCRAWQRAAQSQYQFQIFYNLYSRWCRTLRLEWREPDTDLAETDASWWFPVFNEVERDCIVAKSYRGTIRSCFLFLFLSWVRRRGLANRSRILSCCRFLNLGITRSFCVSKPEVCLHFHQCCQFAAIEKILNLTWLRQ